MLYISNTYSAKQKLKLNENSEKKYILKSTLKNGNCIVHDDSPLKPIIPKTDLKDIYINLKSITCLKTILNNLIEEKEREFKKYNDIVENDYTKVYRSYRLFNLLLNRSYFIHITNFN